MEHRSHDRLNLVTYRTVGAWGSPLRPGRVGGLAAFAASLSAIDDRPRPATPTSHADAALIPGWAWRNWRDQPELLLLFAVLHDAIDILRRGPARNARLFAETRDWFLSDDVLWPASFLNVCEALDLEPERLLARLAGYLGPLRDRNVAHGRHPRVAAGQAVRSGGFRRHPNDPARVADPSTAHRADTATIATGGGLHHGSP